MLRSLVLTTIWLVLSLAACLGDAYAQRPYEPYRPYRPTLTRYLDYFRAYNDSPELGGALSLDGSPSYQGFVQPRDQLRQDLSGQRLRLGELSERLETRVDQLDYRLGRLSKDVDDLGTNSNRLQTIRRSGASPTGTGGTFMNYSNFFQRVR